MEISKESIKRLAKDIKEVRDKSLKENGIYYVHDEENILKGYALIYGPENTPYSYGNYMFEFIFPYNYPFSPPSVIFHTNADRIRMNPNLYRSGKVCISILNTWKGEQWTSCQTIKTVLFSLLTILNDKPLLNEPGVRENHSDFNNYNEIIKFKNIDTAIFKVLLLEDTFPIKIKFKDIIRDKFLENYKKIVDLTKNQEKRLIRTEMYNMIVNIDYDDLNKKLNELYILLQN